ncbi:hypothetical protein Kisp01_45100 [Kineosporia sp. NBRC 101677]|uniref:AzlD domain-containing protein n=1 Tax=Kineosporia sp. NBRC 101677 TaxID=3032197 RepID=UPI0024A27DB0|nr:AzlD domain-containing protein [Kineosporia sp. NBRC 101677]GLY17496.1 hypothetical protein Kisp01_45100 [Kineosporia sp. NBRC 101677]
MTGILAAVLALAVINVIYKGAGPALLGDRTFPTRVEAVIVALPAVLLAALLVVDLAGPHWRDADWTLLPGLAAAVLLRALWQRPHLLCLLVAGLVTAGLRALVG